MKVDVNNHLATLENYNGYYSCSKDSEGKRIGPLVGYEGKYKAPDGAMKNFVGEEYFNFAKVEEAPWVRNYFAKCLAGVIEKKTGIPDVVLGAPIGGILLSGDVGRHLGCKCRTIFAEKKITALADPARGLKEQSELIIKRHDINPCDKVVVIEDVCNNFSTTDKMESAIKGRGGKMIAVACFLNRSGKGKFKDILVIELVFRPAKQWKQEDPHVALDIASGNIVWKAKNEWPKLKAAMSNADK